MRNLVFLLAFSALFVLAARRPFVALSLWLWSGLFVPKYWLYGFAGSISYNTVFALITLVGFVISRAKPNFKTDILFVFVILFFIQTLLTSVFSLNLPAVVWTSWQNFAKGMLLFLFVCLILRKAHQFDFFVWAIVLSLGFLGFVEGAKFILSGGGHHIRGPLGHILADNNHFATALSMTLPLIIYMVLRTEEKWLKWGLIGLVFVVILSILGTHSRGGLIGLSVVGSYFWLKSRYKLVLSLLAILMGAVAFSFLPDSWFERMDTIDNVGEDSSFMTRITSWKLHAQLAIDRPLVGGGFKALEDSYVWSEMASKPDIFSFIETPDAGTKGWAAHSIYFQVLGDQGFVGFFLFSWMLLIAFIKCNSIEKYYQYKGEETIWQHHLAKMLKLSLLAYCVSGAALSLAYLEFFYALLGMVICLSMNMSHDVLNGKKRQRTEDGLHTSPHR